MKKNRLLRTATLLLVLTLITSCFVGGTFAKYTTSATGSDHARVAYWGFEQPASITLDLFKSTYDGTVNSGNADVIAPGTSGSAEFAFLYTDYNSDITAPEVDYTFEVTTNGSIDTNIKSNPAIQWALYKENTTPTWGTWDTMIAAINALDGNVADNKYEANSLPAAFNDNQTYVIAWRWAFENTDLSGTSSGYGSQNEWDTAMGNMDALENVSLEITITATQID